MSEEKCCLVILKRLFAADSKLSPVYSDSVSRHVFDHADPNFLILLCSGTAAPHQKAHASCSNFTPFPTP